MPKKVSYLSVLLLPYFSEKILGLFFHYQQHSQSQSPFSLSSSFLTTHPRTISGSVCICFFFLFNHFLSRVSRVFTTMRQRALYSLYHCHCHCEMKINDMSRLLFKIIIFIIDNFIFFFILFIYLPGDFIVQKIRKFFLLHAS